MTSERTLLGRLLPLRKGSAPRSIALVEDAVNVLPATVRQNEETRLIHRSLLAAAIAAGTAMLAACGGGTGTTANSAIPLAGSMTRSAASDAVASFVTPDAPLVIHVGFGHAPMKKSKYGPLAFYAPNAGATKVINVKAGAKVVFLNDDTISHTASGLGAQSFPKTFDNKSGPVQTGSKINGGLTWSTGTLSPGTSSQTLTVGPKGVYYFGCFYHYGISTSMRNVIVAQ